MKPLTDKCSACHAADKAPSRCSQCKWTVYCSKTCQRDHWRAGHRQMCGKLKILQRFRGLEQQWWATRPMDELQMYVNQFGLQPKSMRFFGEVLFLICGLKSCVLLSNLPPTWRQSFACDVIDWKHPAEYQLTGDLVLGNTSHSDFAVAEQVLRLAVSYVDAHGKVRLAATDGGVSGLVQEHELARVLDYPVALSECNEAAPMIEVGYFLEESQERVILTSYCAIASAQHMQRVQQHFRRYQSCGGGLQLTLETSQI
eukprot:jgi/Phyca11/127033/e_gw1.66.208.1